MEADTDKELEILLVVLSVFDFKGLRVSGFFGLRRTVANLRPKKNLAPSCSTHERVWWALSKTFFQGSALIVQLRPAYSDLLCCAAAVRRADACSA